MSLRDTFAKLNLPRLLMPNLVSEWYQLFPSTNTTERSGIDWQKKPRRVVR